MNQINFQAAFETLASLVDRSVDYRSSEELRQNFAALAYKYKQAINSFVSESKYAQQDIEEFERYEKTFNHGFRLYRPGVNPQNQTA
jgi:hypothetical protein